MVKATLLIVTISLPTRFHSQRRPKPAASNVPIMTQTTVPKSSCRNTDTTKTAMTGPSRKRYGLRSGGITIRRPAGVCWSRARPTVCGIDTTRDSPKRIARRGRGKNEPKLCNKSNEEERLDFDTDGQLLDFEHLMIVAVGMDGIVQIL